MERQAANFVCYELCEDGSLSSGSQPHFGTLRWGRDNEAVTLEDRAKTIRAKHAEGKMNRWRFANLQQKMRTTAEKGLGFNREFSGGVLEVFQAGQR